MPNALKRRKPETSPLLYRQIAVRAEDAGDDATLRMTLATENPVQVYDYDTGAVIGEILAMGGAQWDTKKGQVPLLDTHNKYEIGAVLGSIRDLSIEGDKLRGVAHFAANEAGRNAYELVKSGHVTDVSVSARIEKAVTLREGQSVDVKGKTYQGPARVVTKWRVLEGSVVPIGADSRATFDKVRRAYLDPEQARAAHMDEKFLETLRKLGMPSDLEGDAALEWATANLNRSETAAAKSGVQGTQVITHAPPAFDADAVRADAQKLAREEVTRALNEERTRQETIRKLCNDSPLDNRAALAEQYIAERLAPEDVARKLLEEERKGRQPVGTRIEAGLGGTEKFRAAVLDGVTVRSMHAAGFRLPNDFKTAPGAQDFQRKRLPDLARQLLEAEGVSTRHMSDRDICRRSFDTNRSSDGAGYLTTGNFANLLLDASNKTLLASYNEVARTWDIWARRAESVADFKSVNRVRIGEAGYIPMVGENDDYKDLSVSDAKESYKVEKRGAILSLSWETWINDDLGAFTRAVSIQSASMQRTINQSVYQLLFDNAALSDGIALFHASHGSNTVASDLSVSVLDTAFSAMMLQTGINSTVYLGIAPKFLIVAPGISGTAAQLLSSLADPAAGGSSAGNANTANIYGPGGMRHNLQLIVEPLLAGNDTDSWYLAADSAQIDTVEVAFLQGEETPVFEQETGFVNDSIKYKIRQTWGVKAIDYRGLYRSTGA